MGIILDIEPQKRYGTRMKNKKPISLSYCVKCANRVTETKLGKVYSYEELTGCSKLTKKQWKQGLSKECGFNQKNCPLLKA